jgi:signal transduction histidine kinase
MQLNEAQADARAQPAILYVDDEERSLKYFGRAFQGDFPIVTAASVAEAERLLARESGRIGVLITDQRMPIETGVQLLDRVKARYPDIVRLLTTAYADLNDAVAAVNRGEIHRYILKPWDIEDLRRELHNAMELYRHRRHEQELLQARRRTIMSLASHIAHELSTPLATIHTAIGSIREYLPDVVRTYREQIDHGTADAAQESILELLETTPRMVLSLVERTNMLIRLLLMNSAEDAEDRGDYLVFSVRQCIDLALRTYPFSEGEETLISMQGEDFDVYGSELLLSYVVFNLLKNALYAISAAKKGEILIRLEPGDPLNRICVRDTGTGISPEVLPHVFEEFFSGKGAGRGTGMGLPFCRRVLQAFGGGIECRSSEGDYTELELTFPTVRTKPGAAPPAGDDAT